MKQRNINYRQTTKFTLIINSEFGEIINIPVIIQKKHVQQWLNVLFLATKCYGNKKVKRDNYARIITPI